MKTELDERFEYGDDHEWRQWIMQSLVYGLLLSASIAVGLIRLGAFIAEKFCE